ncbi:MAG: serine hydrolase, partial [Gemmatimonadota bacterium]|nr:serine hydrolase [Gemmatimonadota bacterium]
VLALSGAGTAPAQAVGLMSSPGPRTIAARVDSILAPFVAAHDFSGAVLLTRRGDVLARRSYGLADLAHGKRVTPTTRFGIGSVSKTFTAAAIEALAGAGRLTLTDPIQRYVPEFTIDSAVTLAHLLAHTAGIPDYFNLPEYASRQRQRLTLAQFAELIGRRPLDFAPGTQSRYSNSGYKLLALVIERVSGRPFADYVRSELLSKAGLRNSGLLRDGVTVAALARGYDPGFPPDWLQTSAPVSPSWAEGAGSLYSTVDDLARWAERMRSKPRTTMPGEGPSHAAFGWGERTRFGVKGLEQTGRVPMGYASFLAVYPEPDVIVVVLSNIQSAAAEQIGLALAALALAPDSVPHLTVAPRLVAVRGEALTAYAGRYEIAPGFVLTVENGERGLLLAGPDGALLPLNAVAPPTFFFRPLYVTVRFDHDTTGRITGLDWAGQVTARRLP